MFTAKEARLCTEGKDSREQESFDERIFENIKEATSMGSYEIVYFLLLEEEHGLAGSCIPKLELLGYKARLEDNALWVSWRAE